MAKLVASFEYTDAELLALYREAFAAVSVKGRSYTIGDRSFTAQDLNHIRDTITWLEQRITTASGGIASNLVRLNRR